MPLELMACTSPHRASNSHERSCQRILGSAGGTGLAGRAFCFVSSLVSNAKNIRADDPQALTSAALVPFPTEASRPALAAANYSRFALER